MINNNTFGMSILNYEWEFLKTLNSKENVVFVKMVQPARVIYNQVIKTSKYLVTVAKAEFTSLASLSVDQLIVKS